MSTTESYPNDVSSGDAESVDTLIQETPLSITTYVASGVVNLLALALPLTILQIYDRVLPNASFDTLSALVIALGCVVIVDGVLKYFRSAVINWSAASFTHTLSINALSAMLSTRSSRFGRTTASEHLERLNAVNGLGSHLGSQSRAVAVDILFIPIFASVIILVGGMIFFVVLSLFAVFGYLALRRTKSLNEAIEEKEQFESRKNDFILEVLKSMQTVKSSAMEPLMMRRFERMQSSASMVTKRIIGLTGTAQTYSALYASMSVMLIVGVGAVLVLNGRLTLGALACCMLLSSQLLQPLMRSLASWNEIQLAKHRKERVRSIFDDSDPINVKTTQYQSRFNPKSVTFRNVTVQYENTDPLFENLDVQFRAGSIIAVKGADGSGRSSLLRALLGDSPITDGEICIGDEAVSQATRHLVRFVGQTPTVFRGTILENLTMFGELPAKTAISASRAVGLDEEIVRMPLGYDTVLKSAAGRDIPAPTAQRISIARALATRPSVLILDEANTLLDLSGEQRFLQALERLRGKITIILATHRPSIIRLADEAYEVSDRNLVRLGDGPADVREAS